MAPSLKMWESVGFVKCELELQSWEGDTSSRTWLTLLLQQLS